MRKLLILLLLIPVNSAADDFLIASLGGADLISTELVLVNGRELNPIMKDRITRIALKSVTTAAVITVRHELIKHNHKKAAKVVTGIVIVIWGGAAINNAIQMRKNGSP